MDVLVHVGVVGRHNVCESSAQCLNAKWRTVLRNVNKTVQLSQTLVTGNV